MAVRQRTACRDRTSRCLSVSFATVVIVTSAVRAAPGYAAPQLEVRRAILSDSAVNKIGGKVPQDLIILIGVAMLVAFLCLVLAIVNVCFPKSRSSRLEGERERARSELRVRGAGQHHVIERKHNRRANGVTDSVLSQATADSKSHLLSSQSRHVAPQSDMYKMPFHSGAGSAMGPKVADDRLSRSSRGYSFYNKNELLNNGAAYSAPASRPNPHRGQSSSSALVVPVQARGYSDNQSETSSTAVGSLSSAGVMGPRPLPSHARAARARHLSSPANEQGQKRISSTAMGRPGSTAQQNRSYDKQWRHELPMPPQLVGYSPDRATPPRSKLSSSRYELKRSITDPRDSLPSSRRDSFSNDNASPIRSPSYFDGSGSESHSNEGTPTSASIQNHPLLSSSRIPRTRPLGLYDLEAPDSAQGAEALTSLLDGRPYDAPRSAKSSWRAYN